MWREKDEPTKNASTSDGSRVKNVMKFVSEHWSSFNNNLERLCGLKISDVSSFEKFTQFLYRPTDPASLGMARALFGLCMVIDVVEERGFADVDVKWGDPWDCHFPLIHGMKAPSLPWMIVIYTVMWIGAFGIALGLYFKIACACFVLPYWYIFLLEKSYWNNHTYLYGIVATLFWGTRANKYFALDASNAKRNGDSVPYWNYFILKFQFFTLYFLAGLKKFGWEWLEGYSMMNLSRHWVFHPFKIFLSTEQIDFLVVHWFGFIFDLSVGFWMLFEKTRIPSMIFCTTFHFMNSRLFSIGMFPYVCLATMPLFCRVDWPRRLRLYFRRKQKVLSVNTNTIDASETDSQAKEPMKLSCLLPSSEIACNEATHEEKTTSEEENKNYIVKSESEKEIDEKDNDTQLLKNSIELDEKETSVYKKIRVARQSPKATRKQKYVASLLLCHIVLQFFLPYSHFISKGYNNWVPGLYGYSWDMMVHAWDTILVVIKVHDNANNKIRYLDPNAWVQGDRWLKHGDMALQYSQCLKDNLMRRKEEASRIDHQSEDKEKWMKLSTNLSIYMDVWCSLNGRFQQRIFDPNVDMLTVDWHPFKSVSFLMPLLTQYNSYRHKMDEIEQHVFTWSNYTDVLFVADFPGLYLENYISTDFSNISLTVLEGEVIYSEEESTDVVTVSKKNSIPVETGKFHRIKTTSSYPACYMYTYTNQTKQLVNERNESPSAKENTPWLLKQINYKTTAWIKTFVHITNAFLNLVYDVPMVRRY
ncbi:PREDICTED: vitamin K-dependent gamma-carboxylase isoform X2 [Vollenhovia emeryi]|uniref:vitamin K-dependent gamma-carboxylase isoform X2 n=1 Tax=Vollenhovia emeryi TaxID=411798 RepID=UPI0005F4C065|nr:PREDICTED: vitamin K-dependent gamma-carboxylase isoform X2 [Vollenhovia emeryi]